MRTYIVATDAVHRTIRARNLAEAFAKLGLRCREAGEWEAGVVNAGGYGTILEDGVVIARAKGNP